MKKCIIFLLLLINAYFIYGQITFTEFTFYANKKDTLKANLYQPSGNIKGILVVFVHGGGFRKGTKDFKDDVSYCKALTEKGYHAVSIEYRLFFKGKNYNREERIPFYEEAYSIAVEDLYKCINYLVQNEMVQDVDVTNVFISGGSAGATTALAAILPKFDKLKTNFNIAGVIAAAGATIKINEIKKIEIPIMLLHGLKDDIVNPNCITYKIPGNETIDRCGSKQIFKYRKKQGMSTLLIIEPGSGHEVAWQSMNKHIDRIDAFINDALSGKAFIENVTITDK